MSVITGVHTSLPFPHKIVAASETSEPFLLISGPGIKSEEESLDLQITSERELYLKVKHGAGSYFRQPLEVMLRWEIP